MPKLVASSRSVILADPGAHHYRFAGVEVAPKSDVFLYNLIELGGGESNLTQVPHHIVFDRSYIHGDPRKGGRRGIALNARDAAIINSYLSDFKEVGADSQAIAGWNGPGPFRIENNYLEAAGENVMFGGADPSIHGLVPADIHVLRNHMTKPLRWKLDHPSYEGTAWAVKNLFELKNARRVLIESNIFEHNWPHAQNGFAILFTVRNQDGGAPWSVVEDVTFRKNVVRHVAAGFNILGSDDIHESRQTSRISIHNNLITDVGGKWGGNGRLFQLLNGTAGVSITHNTAEQSGGVVFGGDHGPHQGFVFRNNVMPDNGAGFVGSGTAAGNASIERYFPRAVIAGNVFHRREARRLSTRQFLHARGRRSAQGRCAMDQLINPCCAPVLAGVRLAGVRVSRLSADRLAAQAAVPARRSTRANRTACHGHRGGLQRGASYRSPDRKPAGLGLSPRPSCGHRWQRWLNR